MSTSDLTLFINKLHPFLLPDYYPLTSLLQEYYVHEGKKNSRERAKEKNTERRKKSVAIEYKKKSSRRNNNLMTGFF